MLQTMVEQLSGRKHIVRSLVQMDDPDHMKYRVLTQGWFMGDNLRKLQARVDELANLYVDRLGDLGGECDFVKMLPFGIHCGSSCRYWVCLKQMNR